MTSNIATRVQTVAHLGLLTVQIWSCRSPQGHPISALAARVTSNFQVAQNPAIPFWIISRNTARGSVSVWRIGHLTRRVQHPKVCQSKILLLAPKSHLAGSFSPNQFYEIYLGGFTGSRIFSPPVACPCTTCCIRHKAYQFPCYFLRRLCWRAGWPRSANMPGSESAARNPL